MKTFETEDLLSGDFENEALKKQQKWIKLIFFDIVESCKLHLWNQSTSKQLSQKDIHMLDTSAIIVTIV